jgi:2-isopropylmalate synthase
MPMQKHKVEIFDTTLRDGSQGQDISYSVADKLAIAEKLDWLGVDYIEGGWPSPGNAKDLAFFKQAKRLKLKHSRLVAFGSTCRVGEKPGQSAILKGVLDAETRDACIFGKSWDLHVTKVLKTTLDENLRMVHDSVAFLKKRRQRVFFDAEHFFDGFRANAAYALSALKAAYDAGADALVLCDTNGGCLPWDIERMTAEARKAFPGAVLGVHVHNDGELAVANSLAAVRQGVRHVQGTINGYGERCGNANLVSIIPDLSLKMGFASIPAERLARLTEASRFVASVANLPQMDHQPYAGKSAFAHKAGMHIDAILKAPGSYEHMDPALVGNERRLLASEQAGKATILSKAKAWGVRLDNAELAKAITADIKDRELAGYQYEGADASLELLMRRHLGKSAAHFKLHSYHVDVERRSSLEPAEASVKIEVGGRIEFTVAEGNGPVNALDAALRLALQPHFPQWKGTQLTDYKVRVLQSSGGTAAKVRVLMETSDGKDSWTTVGVHENIIEASWEALMDSFEYKLLKSGKR